jgi:uncharacterized membrane protein YphA (DoxX/SURF4 family)
MAKKKAVKNTNTGAAAKSMNVSGKTNNIKGCVCCCEKKWSIVPLRFALGLMFLAVGLPSLISMIAGGHQIAAFYHGLGIPLAGFFAWLVAILEVIGGVFLLLGFATWMTGLVLGIILVVATITTTLKPLNWVSLTMHLVYIAALVAVMYGSKYFGVRCTCPCHWKR